MLTYRQAIFSDRNHLIDLVKEHCIDSKLSYTEEAVAQYVTIGLNNTNALVAEVDGKVVGVISFIVYNHQFTGIPCAKKIAWFVSKEHRGKVGLALLRKAEEEAKALGATHFYCSTPTKMVTDYMPIETEYQKELV